ncbi:MAG: hypothetical protein A2231_02575 [Candidatus Firestonebacteria bacterium RIFOXYA2_FULL_40_8]|nr:MAG: hypothetical protein A2231_02575 [Candidatus Firestonebacteria bacterium RIFOXYA2_FULL_40_8]
MRCFNIYSDESRHKNERFMLLGGLWVDEVNLKVLEDEVQKLRKKNGFVNNNSKHVDFVGELKWCKVSQKYLHVYVELVDLAFDLIFRDIIRINVMLIDTGNSAVIEHSNMKKEGFFKLLYQLYYHNCKIPGYYKIYPDSITNPEQEKVNFVTLAGYLNSGLKNKFALQVNPIEVPFGGRFVKSITPVNSKLSQAVQIVDVMIGAIGYFQNRLFEVPGARQSKITLMKHIFEKIVLSGGIKIEGKKYLVAKSTKFNIWLFRPNKKPPC